MYKDLIKNKIQHSLQFPKTIVPNPNATDYENQFINRFFTQKVNDDNGFIFEIDEDEFNLLNVNPYWKVVKMRWRIAGPLDSVFLKDKLIDIGVKKSNIGSISEATKNLKNISLYLPNILQFYKG